MYWLRLQKKVKWNKGKFIGMAMNFNISVFADYLTISPVKRLATLNLSDIISEVWTIGVLLCKSCFLEDM